MAWRKKVSRTKEEDRVYQQAWRKKNQTSYNEKRRKIYHRLRGKDPSISRAYHRKYHLNLKYGITLEDYDEMLTEQGGLCYVCRQPETVIRRGEVKNLDVDHNHDTGQVRGLLCSACNTALGLLKEDPLRVKALLEYLERANAAAS